MLLLRPHVQREGGRSLKPLLVVIDIILLRNPIFSPKSYLCSKVKRSQKESKTLKGTQCGNIIVFVSLILREINLEYSESAKSAF